MFISIYFWTTPASDTIQALLPPKLALRAWPGHSGEATLPGASRENTESLSYSVSVMCQEQCWIICPSRWRSLKYSLFKKHSGYNLCSLFHDLLIKCSQSEFFLRGNNSHNIFNAVIFLLQFTQSWGLLCFHSPPSPLPSHNGFEGGPAPPQSTSLESRSSSRRSVLYCYPQVIILNIISTIFV